jgi:hypothetical protein
MQDSRKYTLCKPRLVLVDAPPSLAAFCFQAQSLLEEAPLGLAACRVQASFWDALIQGQATTKAVPNAVDNGIAVGASLASAAKLRSCFAIVEISGHSETSGSLARFCIRRLLPLPPG